MKVDLNEEIKDYHEQLILGLDLKKCILGGLAIALCISEYVYFDRILHFDSMWLTAIYVFSVVPFGFFMLFKYNGKSAWQVFKLWVRYHFFQDHHLKYRPSNYYKRFISTKYRKSDKEN